MCILCNLEKEEKQKLKKYKINGEVEITKDFYRGEKGFLVEHIEKQHGFETYHYYRIKLKNYPDVSPVFRTSEFICL